jgi:hypothetical protein
LRKKRDENLIKSRTLYEKRTEKMKVNCQHCGKTFNTKPHRIKEGKGKYCSKACFDTHRRETDIYKGKNNPRYTKEECICVNCGKKFLRIPAEIKKYGGKYCSKKCHYTYRKTTGAFSGTKHPGYNKIERICKYCGKIFLTKRCLAESAKYCNKNCREKAHHPTEKICRYCGKTFTIYTSRLQQRDMKKRGRFCSRRCFDHARSEFEEYLGINHPNWNGGYFPYYGEKWRNLRRNILELASKSSELSKENKEKLHIHHIIPLKNYINKYLELCITPYIENIKYVAFELLPFDFIPITIFEEANSRDNLIVLTMDEHKKYEGMPIGFFEKIKKLNHKTE